MNFEKGQIVFLSAKAITDGVRQCVVKSVHVGYCYVTDPKGVDVFANVKHLSLTRHEALKNAEAQRVNKLKDLEKQIANIKKIEF